MELQDIRAGIQNSLHDAGIYRADSFVNTGINEGYRLVGLFALFDERRASVNVDGTRNFNTLPTDSSARCIAPLYVANTNTGARINPAKLEDLEFHANRWEGVVGTDNALYYTFLAPYHHSAATVLVCPIQNIGRTQLTFVGAFEPVALSADTDEPRMSEDYQDLLYYYGMFYGYLGEPEKGADALAMYQAFVERLGAYVVSLKARFPGGRDYEPIPPEFRYDDVKEQEQREQREQRSERQ